MTVRNKAVKALVQDVINVGDFFRILGTKAEELVPSKESGSLYSPNCREGVFSETRMQLSAYEPPQSPEI
jgi:hypothetical protein